MKIFKISISAFVIFSALIVSIGSILFGYNSAVISGALLFLADEFSLDFWELGLLVSSLVLGAAIGSAIGGIIADRYGRKVGFFITAILFILGTFIIVYIDQFSMIFVGRFIQGIAIGIISVIVPLYLSEIAPTPYRGAIVLLNQLAIVLGITISYIVDYKFSFEGHWRMMFAGGFIPAIIFFVGLFFIPKSPSYAHSKGKEDLARSILKKLKRRNTGEKNISHGMKDESDYSMKSWRSIFCKENKYPMIAGVGISILQQITGINIVIYFAPFIFSFAKCFDNNSAIFVAVALGIVKVIMTIVALFFVDKVGRKKLLHIGAIGMGVSMILLAISFLNFVPGIFGVISMVIYLSFYSISLGPITWLIISEIFALPIRGRAMGIAAFSNWMSNWIVSLAFLPIIGFLGLSATFYMFALICFGAYYFIKNKIPETKNKSFSRDTKILEA